MLDLYIKLKTFLLLNGILNWYKLYKLYRTNFKYIAQYNYFLTYNKNKKSHKTVLHYNYYFIKLFSSIQSTISSFSQISSGSYAENFRKVGPDGIESFSGCSRRQHEVYISGNSPVPRRHLNHEPCENKFSLNILTT